LALKAVLSYYFIIFLLENFKNNFELVLKINSETKKLIILS